MPSQFRVALRRNLGAGKVRLGGVAPAPAPSFQPSPAPAVESGPLEPPMTSAEIDAIEKRHALELEGEYARGHEDGRQQGFRQGYLAASSTVAGSIEGVRKSADAFLAELRAIGELQSNFQAALEAIDAVLAETSEAAAEDVQKSAQIMPKPIPRPTLHRAANGVDDGPWLKTLAIMAERHPMQLTHSDLAALAGMAPRGGAFLKHIRELRNRLLVTEAGTLLTITPEGLALAGAQPAETPKSTGEMIGMWERKLPGGKGGAALRLLVRLHPRAIGPDQLAEQIEMAPRGGAFLKLMRHLRRNKLIEDHDHGVRATAAFFPVASAGGRAG